MFHRRNCIDRHMKKLYKIYLDNKVLSFIFGILLLLCIIFVLKLVIGNLSSKNILAEGTLIMNTDKPNYLPGEKMNISILSFDDSGKNFCTSNLKLEITSPDSSVSIINVVPSPNCNSVGTTNDPDYSASQTLDKTGNYKLKLTNLDTKKVLETKIEVSQNLSFDVKRSGATRLGSSKPNRYPMIITVKTNQDFKGEIKDQIPDGVKVVWQGPAKIDGKNIIWDADLKAGEENTFSYEYEVNPEISGILKFGPININRQNIESVWQVFLTKQNEKTNKKIY